MANPHPVTLGRPKGAVNKATRDIKEICRGHGPEVIEGLLRLSKEADSDASKIAASKEILDRAYGKARQPLDGPGQDGSFEHIIRIIGREPPKD